MIKHRLFLEGEQVSLSEGRADAPDPRFRNSRRLVPAGDDASRPVVLRIQS